MTRLAADELAKFNIRVNAILTGSFAMGQSYENSWEIEGFQLWVESSPWLWAGGQPDPASMVLFLCSNSASRLTGRVISMG